MHWTPDDIAASTGSDLAIKPGDVLYKYLENESTIRFESLREHFMAFGLDLIEDEMVRLMAIQQDILFTEGSDDRGRFWRATIVPDQQSGPTREGYLDHRITDQFDDAMDQDFSGEEEEFTGRDLEGINVPPEAGQMNDLNAEETPGDPSGFDSQPEPPDITVPATDDREIPPAAVPRALPDIVVQAMATQMPEQDALEPRIPEPGMVPGPTDQVDMTQAPAQPGPGPGPGEEQPAPQTGQMVQPQMVQPQMVQPQMVQPQIVQPEPDFGDDGADYTIDPFLNALRGAVDQEEAGLPQSPQTTNEPVTGARTNQDRRHAGAPRRYSKRMREAREKREQAIMEAGNLVRERAK